jgi:ABC-2 type transport system permease protein
MPMNARIILAIARKDIVDAIKNTYILFSLILPVGMSLLFRVMLPDDADIKQLGLAVYDPGQSQLVAQLQVNPAVRLIPVDAADQVRAQVKDDVVAGLAIPAGFDAAVAGGKAPELPVYYNGGRSASQIATIRQILESSLRVVAGQVLPAKLVFSDVTATGEEAPVFSLSAYYLILLLVMGLTMVGVFVVPTILVEEKEKHTLNAILVSPASFADVAMGKAAVGLVYALLVAAILMFTNGGFTGDVPVSLLAIVLGAFFLVLTGLLMGAIFETAMQVNTWSSIVMLALLVPAMFNMPPRPPEPVATVARLVPTSYLAHAVSVSMSGKATLASVGPDLGILAACSLVVFMAVLWALRRERDR